MAMLDAILVNFNVFLATINLEIDIKTIKFEPIVTDLRSFGGVGGHFGRHLGKKHFSGVLLW